MYTSACFSPLNCRSFTFLLIVLLSTIDNKGNYINIDKIQPQVKLSVTLSTLSRAATDFWQQALNLRYRQHQKEAFKTLPGSRKYLIRLTSNVKALIQGNTLRPKVALEAALKTSGL